MSSEWNSTQPRVTILSVKNKTQLENELILFVILKLSLVSFQQGVLSVLSCGNVRYVSADSQGKTFGCFPSGIFT